MRRFPRSIAVGCIVSAFLVRSFFVPAARAEELTSASFRLLDPVITPIGFGTSTDYQLRSGLVPLGRIESASAGFQMNPGPLRYPFVSVPTVSAVVGNKKVGLSWTEANGFLGLNPSGYDIGQSVSAGGPYTYASVSATLTSSNRAGLTNGTTYYFVIVVKDAFGNPIATSSEISATPLAPVAVTPATNRVTIQNNAEYTITVPSTVNDATFDVSGVATISGATTTAVLDGSMSIEAETAIGRINVDLPAGIRISGPAGTWNGIVNTPQARSNSSVTPTPDAGKTASVAAAIEVGAGDVPLTLDRAVRILIADQAGASAGYSRSGVFTPITAACSADTQSAGDAVSDSGDCTTTAGDDLAIWTKHFTVFVAYTQTNISTDSGNSSGAGGAETPADNGGIVGLASFWGHVAGVIGAANTIRETNDPLDASAEIARSLAASPLPSVSAAKTVRPESALLQIRTAVAPTTTDRTRTATATATDYARSLLIIVIVAGAIYVLRRARKTR